jgi:hypothetical protein
MECCEYDHRTLPYHKGASLGDRQLEELISCLWLWNAPTLLANIIKKIRDKSSSLFGLLISGQGKYFITLTTGVNFIKPSTLLGS